MISSLIVATPPADSFAKNEYMNDAVIVNLSAFDEEGGVKRGCGIGALCGEMSAR